MSCDRNSNDDDDADDADNNYKPPYNHQAI
jgi:hypothetical protein